MSRRRLRGFVEAIAAGHRPRGFRADEEEAAVVRAAILLKAERPVVRADDAAPSDAFVTDLFARLSREAAQPQLADRGAVSLPAPLRLRRAGFAVAAAAVLVTGTVVVNNAVQNGGGSVPVPSVSAAAIRTGSFSTPDGRVLGQVVAYRGHPSWVFMNIDVPRYEGSIECRLQVADGSVVAFGTFDVHKGVGHFSKGLSGVDVTQLRGATLTGATGSRVAAATFSN